MLLPLAFVGGLLAAPVALVTGDTRPLGVGADIAELLGAPVAAPFYLLGQGIDAAFTDSGPRSSSSPGAGAPR